MGDTVKFDIAPSTKQPGQFTATNITGGTGTDQQHPTTNTTRTRGGNNDMGEGSTGQPGDK
eukprot:3572022-Heterocapsa_arctica.AAC.1